MKLAELSQRFATHPLAVPNNRALAVAPTWVAVQ
jgi:hypothetical protein